MGASCSCLHIAILLGSRNGHVAPYEACDDFNRIDGDGCSAFCKVEPQYQCLPCDSEKPEGLSCCIWMDQVTEEAARPTIEMRASLAQTEPDKPRI